MDEASKEAAGAPGARSPLGRVERVLMAGSMGLLCVLTMANVLVRYFTDISFAFTEEISVALLVVMTLVGASHAFATNHHIAITFFVSGSTRLRTWSQRFATLCSLVMFAVLCAYGVLMAWDDYDFEVTSPSLGVPQWLYTVWLPVLSALIVVRLLASLRRRAS
ncbi:TRAP transporter small permease [Propionivibrio dicarboxylicus]|uniref:TRAP transporter small permease protein n=1 Tax=Propionivibrio dicarboxylicus TaxID=83767 RepID=A0A1G8G6I9_9RHOO|nr:TRAP transporter small permease [Propionivibrio dicarboxylicus]SDH89992.1 TRAP-type C4-dicarboxylate transport system, small permease component [Propionivibrio dicarboxylicus]